MQNLSKLWSKINSVSQEEVRLAVLEDEIELHKSRLRPAGSGNIHSTISGIEQRIEELKKSEQGRIK